MARRTGQIIPRGDKKWLVRIYLGTDSKGKRRYHSRTIRGARKDAVAYLNKTLREKDLGELVEPSRVTLAEYGRTWLETAARSAVREKTFADYEGMFSRYIEPALGTRRLRDITALEIDQMYRKMGERLSPRTIRYCHSVLHNALEQAVKWQLLPKNPAKFANPPRNQKKEMAVLSVDQIRSFLNEARKDRWAPLWHLLVTTGLRPNEALALKWSDLEGNRLSVQRRLSRTSSNTWKFEDTKTTKSRRSVVLSPTLLGDLRRYKVLQNEVRLAAGTAYADHGLMFAGDLGSPPDYRNLMSRNFRRILERAGIPDVRPYTLRHSAATMMMSAGVHPKVVSEMLGHANIALTLQTYSHVLPTMQEEASDKVEQLLANHG